MSAPQITGWDFDGFPVFARDELDLRLSALVDRMREHDKATGSETWFNFDLGVSSLTCDMANLSLAEEAVDLLRELVQRERHRRSVTNEALGLTSTD